MLKPRFIFELKHYSGMFFQDLAWLPVEVCRATSAMVTFALMVLIYRLHKLMVRRRQTIR